MSRLQIYQKNKMDNELFDKVTIIIPTFNRYSYLLRLLNYYKSYEFPMKILILDSSTDVLEQNKFQHLLSNRKINYQKIDLDFFEKVANGLKNVSTPYSVLCGDDDFITPIGIKQSIDFLEKNPDFTIAHGLYIGFWSRSYGENKQQFFWKSSNRFSSIVFSEPEERMTHHLSSYLSTFYAVHRTKLTRLIFEEAAKLGDSTRFGELLLSSLVLVYGKMKCLDVFYVSREATPNSAGVRSKRLIDFIRDGTYNEKYAKFRDCLSTHLAKKSQLSIGESEKAVDDAMSVYLSACIRSKESTKNILVRKIRDILLDLRLPDWLYEGIRSLYRKLFLSKQKRMDDFRSFADTPLAKYYEEISNIYKHVVSYSKK